MADFPTSRIVGVETEFGCLVQEDSRFKRPEDAVEAIKDHLFYTNRIGAIDRDSRDDVFEPALSGGFLMNGARLYIDAVGSHLEYATAECLDFNDLVANDRAGQKMIVRAMHELGIENEVDVYNNSIDHFGGHTFGCHENYLIRADEDYFNFKAHYLIPFLVTRQIFAGVGRVGGHILTAERGIPNYRDVQENPVDYIWVSHVYGVVPDTSVPFQLSQRADHIIKTIASRVRFNRAMINPKWEHYYSLGDTTRLHLLFGESNQNEFAYALKVGTTTLMLRLIEDDLVPANLLLAQPLMDLRTISRDQDFKWIVTLLEGDTMSAIDLQRLYLQAAQVYKGETSQIDWILKEWESTLDGLEKDPMSMGDRIDWVAKRQMVEQYRAEEGLDWTDDALHSVDLEYHNIDPAKGLFFGLQEMGSTTRICSDLDVLTAVTDPPQNTRAKARGRLVENVMKKRNPRGYRFDWNGAHLDNHRYVNLEDPYDTYEGVS